jgi:hypothetical protein
VKRWTLTARVGGKVAHERFEDLASALRALEERGHELQGSADRGAVDLKIVRTFEPHEQVVARLEVSGPGRVRGGVDVRGDGSAEPYTGRLLRKPVDRRDDENAYAALRRAVSG